MIELLRIDNYSPLWISIQTAAAATLISFVFGLVTAYLMSGYQGRWKGLIDGLLILPVVLPPTVVGYILLLILGRSGFIGQILARFDISVIFTWPATVIAATVVSAPLMYKTSRAVFEQIEPMYTDAARVLGCNSRQVFFRVVLPLSWPGIIAGTVLSFARALGEFGATLMLAGSIPGQTQTMPIAIYFAAESGDHRQALTWVLIIIAISLLMTIFSNRWLHRCFIRQNQLKLNRNQNRN